MYVYMHTDDREEVMVSTYRWVYVYDNLYVYLYSYAHKQT
jgi:hypothetical protein